MSDNGDECPRMSSNSFGQPYDVPRRKILQINELHRGDHICFHRSKIYWHHAIIEWIDVDDQNLHIIHYTNRQGTLGESSCNLYHEKRFSLAKVMKDQIFFPVDVIFLMEHDPLKCLSPDEVVERARRNLGEEKYNPFTNNCEHFAMWCKTGDSISNQMKTLGKQAAKTAAQEGGKRAATKVLGKQAAKAAGREIGKHVGKTTVTKEAVKQTVKIVKKELGKQTVTQMSNEASKQTVKTVVRNEMGKKVFVRTMSKEVGKKTIAKVAQKEIAAKSISNKLVKETVVKYVRDESGKKIAVHSASKQVLKKTVVDVTKNEMGTKIAARSAGKQLSKRSVRQVAEKEVGKRTTSSISGVASEAAIGGAVAILSEIAFASYDIYNAKTKLNAGEITKEEYNDAFNKRVKTGTCNVTGSVAGSVIGQLVIPIPGLGSAIGGAVGGIAASILGNYLFN